MNSGWSESAKHPVPNNEILGVIFGVARVVAVLVVLVVVLQWIEYVHYRIERWLLE